jgi:hypothetical protein
MHVENYEDAEKYLRKALAIQRHVLRVERLKCTRDELRTRLLEIADTLCNLGGVHLESGQQTFSEDRVEGARVAFSEALEVSK